MSMSRQGLKTPLADQVFQTQFLNCSDQLQLHPQMNHQIMHQFSSVMMLLFITLDFVNMKVARNDFILEVVIIAGHVAYLFVLPIVWTVQ